MSKQSEKTSKHSSLPLKLGSTINAFKAAWQSQPPPQIETFLKEWTEPDRRRLFSELVRVDLENRRSLRNLNVETFSISDYYNRFPDYRVEIETALREASDITRSFGKTSRALESKPRIPVSPGDEIDDFELIRKLGEGAFAIVFLARQKTMMRRVALKVSQGGRDEPPTLGQLDHPNIVRVYGVTRDNDAQLQLMCMEYVAGGTLQDVIESIHRMERAPANASVLINSIRETVARSDERPALGHIDDEKPWSLVVCDLGAQLAEALAHAHSKGILHRDIKPANVLMGADGTPKLADFNIAFGAHVSETTAAGYFGGTFAYMSPEQLEACDHNSETTPDQIDRRSDIYSLAIVLWELLSGRRPFEDRPSDFFSSTAADKRRAGPTQESIDGLPESVPDGLKEVLCRCLDPSPSLRYQSASDLARDLGMCTDLRVQALKRPPVSPVIRAAYYHPLLLTVLISLIPNVVLSVANVIYDWNAIVKPLNAEQYFLPVMVWGKLCLYILGVVFGLWKGVQVFMAMRGDPSDSALKTARTGCLALGDLVFGITLATWVVSGILFPILTDIKGANLSTSHYLLFFTSHLLCGLISGNLVIFTLTYLSVRTFYPRLLRDGLSAPPLRRAHERLRMRMEIYFVIAVAVPFISALALGLSLSATGTDYWPAFLTLGLLGAAVLALGVVSKSEVRKNLDALDKIVDLSASL